jgi:DNA adenine methylase
LRQAQMKYMGSKARIAKHLLPLILADKQPDQFYVEPFAGGMNMICNVDGKRIACDSNYYLIQMWKAIMNDWEPPRFVSRQAYEIARNSQDKIAPWIVGWVGFNCSYSGKWFGGYAGVVQTKTGTTRNYQEEAFKNTLKQKTLLKGVDFVCCDYKKLQIPSKSIVYCDPPYTNTTNYKDKFDSDVFWLWAQQLARSGHSVFVSEYVAPSLAVQLWEMPVKSSLSANGQHGGSKKSVERLFRVA